MVPELKETYAQKLHKLISWGHWYTGSNIILAIALSIFYYWDESLPRSFIGVFYLVTNTIGHMAFLTFLLYVLLIFPLTLVFPRTQFIRGFASVVFTIYFGVLALDILCYSHFGYHVFEVNMPKVVALLYSKFDETPTLFIFGFVSLVTIVLSYQLIASNYLWHNLSKVQRTNISQKATYTFVGAFLVSHLTHIWADAKLVLDITRLDNVMPLSYPATAKTTLTKYGLLDSGRYQEEKQQVLEFDFTEVVFPVAEPVCKVKEIRYAAIIATEGEVPTPKGANWTEFSRFASSSSGLNALNDILFSLPKPFQNTMIEQDVSPSLFEVYREAIFFGDSLPPGLEAHLTMMSLEEDVSQFLTSPLLVFYFDKNNLELAAKTSQFLAQTGRLTLMTDVSPSKSTRPSFTSLYVANSNNNTNKDELLGPFDVVPTLLSACDQKSLITLGKNIEKHKGDSFIVNIVDDQLLIFHKDKVVSVNKMGEINAYSTTLQTKLDKKDNLHLLIDAMKLMKKYQ